MANTGYLGARSQQLADGQECRHHFRRVLEADLVGRHYEVVQSGIAQVHTVEMVRERRPRTISPLYHPRRIALVEPGVLTDSTDSCRTRRHESQVQGTLMPGQDDP